jgi:hypothetical protein
MDRRLRPVVLNLRKRQQIQTFAGTLAAGECGEYAGTVNCAVPEVYAVLSEVYADREREQSLQS